jgi:hypothetical protein
LVDRRNRSRAGPWALKIGFLIMAGLALIAIVPASGLPSYRPGEIPHELSVRRTGSGRSRRRSQHEPGKR